MNTPLTAQTREISQSYCKFGSEALLEYLDAFQEGIDGVIQTKDVEYVHKTRVASRRLRATLPLFRFCLPEKTYKKSLKEIKKTTSLLGAPRDLDVQIIFIEHYMNKLKPTEKAAIDLLLDDLKGRRNRDQKTVVKGLKKLTASDALDDLRAFCKQTVATQSSVTYDSASVMEKAQWHISFRLDDFLSLQDYVYLENEKLKHHQMRIYAKKLRYTMETFAPIYKKQMAKEIRTIRAYQEILGEMHDYDVWVESIPKFIEECKSQDTKNVDDQKFEQALLDLLSFIKEKRKETYDRFVNLWAKNKKTGFFDKLKGATERELQQDELQRDLSTNKNNRMVNAAKAFSKKYWPDTEHFSQVSKLALELFDSLVKVHQLGEAERCWLECAAILHDVGLPQNKVPHHKRTAEIILNDTQLPFTSQERQLIASIARYHRKGLPKQKHSNLAGLDPANVHKVRVLASLLRLADSLDYTHGSTVKSLKVMESSDNFTVECDSEVKSVLEEQAFNKKKDLFENVFKKNLALVWKQT